MPVQKQASTHAVFTYECMRDRHYGHHTLHISQPGCAEKLLLMRCTAAVREYTQDGPQIRHGHDACAAGVGGRLARRAGGALLGRDAGQASQAPAGPRSVPDHRVCPWRNRPTRRRSPTALRRAGLRCSGSWRLLGRRTCSTRQARIAGRARDMQALDGGPAPRLGALSLRRCSLVGFVTAVGVRRDGWMEGGREGGGGGRGFS